MTPNDDPNNIDLDGILLPVAGEKHIAFLNKLHEMCAPSGINGQAEHTFVHWLYSYAYNDEKALFQSIRGGVIHDSDDPSFVAIEVSGNLNFTQNFCSALDKRLGAGTARTGLAEFEIGPREHKPKTNVPLQYVARIPYDTLNESILPEFQKYLDQEANKAGSLISARAKEIALPTSHSFGMVISMAAHVNTYVEAFDPLQGIHEKAFPIIDYLLSLQADPAVGTPEMNVSIKIQQLLENVLHEWDPRQDKPLLHEQANEAHELFLHHLLDSSNHADYLNLVAFQKELDSPDTLIGMHAEFVELRDALCMVTKSNELMTPGKDVADRLSAAWESVQKRMTTSEQDVFTFRSTSMEHILKTVQSRVVGHSAPGRL